VYGHILLQMFERKPNKEIQSAVAGRETCTWIWAGVNMDHSSWWSDCKTY